MKKYILFIYIYSAACNSVVSTEIEKEKMTVEMGGPSLEKMLNSYYKLRDALVAGDVNGASKAAIELSLMAESLSVNHAEAINNKKADKVNYAIAAAHPFLISTESEARALAAEKDIESQRKSFQTISLDLYDLAQIMGSGKGKVYLLHCPMAFNNTGGEWLSASTEIKNPYFGSKMLKCGFVKDSL